MSDRNLFPDADRIPRPYTEWRQAAGRAPTEYEEQLGDAIEAAFTEGAWELSALIARLNEGCVRTPDGSAWNEARFCAVIAALGLGEPAGTGGPS